MNIHTTSTLKLVRLTASRKIIKSVINHSALMKSIKIGQIDFCIHNSLPVNNVWFCLVVFPMDEADIERAKEKSTKFTI